MTASLRKKSIDLEEIAIQIAEHVEIKDRTHHFKLYKECFVGSDVVKYFVCAGLVKNVSEAVWLGNLLIKEDYIKHVAYAHGFKNEKLFYEFTEDMKCRVSRNPLVSCLFDSKKISITDEELEEIGYAVFHSSLVQDRQWGLKIYAKSFVGEELVSWLMEKNYARGINQAVAIGKALMDKKLISHVSNEHPFKNEKLFYQLAQEFSEEISLTDLHLTDIDLVDIIMEMKRSLEIKTRDFYGKSYPNCFIGKQAVNWMTENSKLTKCSSEEKAMVLGNYLVRRGVIHHVTNQHLFKNEFVFYQFSKEIDQESITFKWSKSDLFVIAREIRLHVEIKDRTYHFKKYKECFLGNVCVKYLIDSSICEHVPEAIALGNALIQQNIIRHVTNEHKFENGPFFYAFVDLASFDQRYLASGKSYYKVDWTRRTSSSKSNITSMLLRKLSTGRSSKSFSGIPLAEGKSNPVHPQRLVMPVLRESTTIAAEETDEYKECEEQKQTGQVIISSTDLSYLSDDSDDNESLYGSYKGENNKKWL